MVLFESMAYHVPVEPVHRAQITQLWCQTKDSELFTASARRHRPEMYQMEQSALPVTALPYTAHVRL